MPQSNRKGISIRTAILLATAACLVGCVPVGESLSDTAAAPMAPEALPAPVALAPELTGPQPAAVSAAKIAAVLTIPALLPAPDPGPTASPAATAPAPPPVACPPDTVGKWSGPDITGAPVFICRRLTAR